MKPVYKVLVSAPYFQPVLAQFLPVLTAHGIEVVVPKVEERLSEHELLALVGDVDGVIAGDDRFTATVLDAAPRLKVVAKWGTGIDSFDQDAFREKGVFLFNTPNAFSEPVADSVMGYILAFARKLPWMDRDMKVGTWSKIPGVSLRECTLGVVGVGNVGRAVIRRAASFGCRILGFDPVEVPADFLAETGVTMASMAELLRESDFISLNCTLNPTSYHLIDSSAFAAMKAGVVVINTARGPIIDEQALVAALQTGQIAGAALDVYEDEPLPQDSPLRRMETVLLAPHNSNSSPMAWQKVHQSTLESLLRGLKGDHP
jgi:D-3-phosphoglycerate dehydrogenase